MGEKTVDFIIIVSKVLTAAFMILYVLGIPMAFKMASFSKGFGLVGKLPWIGRFLLAWTLFPFYILTKVFNK